MRLLVEYDKIRFMKILYFGPISKKGQASIGGYEAANRKNIDSLSGYFIHLTVPTCDLVVKSL